MISVYYFCFGRSVFPRAQLTHEISFSQCSARIYVFTTKTIMDPLIGFLDSFFFFSSSSSSLKINIFSVCSLASARFFGECSMILTFRLVFLVFFGCYFVHLVNSTRVAMPINLDLLMLRLCLLLNTISTSFPPSRGPLMIIIKWEEFQSAPDNHRHTPRKWDI